MVVYYNLELQVSLTHPLELRPQRHPETQTTAYWLTDMITKLETKVTFITTSVYRSRFCTMFIIIFVVVINQSFWKSDKRHRLL